MCGIAGYVGNGTTEILKRMTNALDYRGPDGFGYFERPGVGLGHRRLSIIDFATGAQPMSSEDGAVTIVFNGEIYNFQELKSELERKGYSFRTHSDTEVVIKLYQEEGERIFARLNGMFALAIWDATKGQLVLGRDRYGQKPLYWFQKEGLFLFASEPKALLRSEQVKKELSTLGLYQFFYFDYLPQPNSLWKNIHKLEAGSYMLVKDNRFTQHQYYSYPETSLSVISVEDAKDSLEKYLSAAVKRHLISDVPIGVFLSGGLDSSTIAYFATKHHPGIKTFSIGFEEKSYDETRYAEEVSRFLKTEHYHRTFTNQELLQVLPKILDKLDEPLGDASLLPTYLLSSFAKERVTVALGGDGGDELFYGYPNHRLHRLEERFAWFQKPHAFGALRSLAHLLPKSDKNLTLSYQLERLAEVLPFPAAERDFLLIGGFDGVFESLLSVEKPAALFDFSNHFLDKLGEKNFSSQMAYQLMRYYLADDILNKVDRAAMFCSLEVRAPLLDTGVADFALRLPSNLKLHGFTSKYILKECMRGKLPSTIIERPKKGFGIPIARWLRSELREYMESVLSTESLERFGVIKPAIAHQLMAEHLSGRLDHRKILWKMIMFQEWCDRWLTL